jgi:hypothetical protein
MKASTILIKARNLIENKGWCQFHLAFDKDGNYADPQSEKACKFSMLGAVSRYCGDNYQSAVNYLQEEASMYIGMRSIVLFNDAYAKNKKDVIELFDKAILKAKRDKK